MSQMEEINLHNLRYFSSYIRVGQFKEPIPILDSLVTETLIS